MTTSLFSHASLVFISALLPFSGLCADEPKVPLPTLHRSSVDEELIIMNGVFAPERENARRATLRNLIDAITRRYPHANITIVGADDVPIGELRLRWGKRPDSGGYPDDVPLQGMLTALREASGRRFELQAFGRNDFVLSAIGGSSSPSRIEVFNLKSLPAVRGLNVGELRVQLSSLEGERRVLGNQFTNDHPRMKENAVNIEQIQAKLASQSKSAEDTTKEFLSQIESIVRITLQQLNPGGTPPNPEFKFHPGTGLLVVVGNEQALEVTRKVIAALN
jgi:hypothetical protein